MLNIVATSIPEDVQSESTTFEWYGFVAASVAMRSVVDWAAQIAPTDVTVLLTGETGTGKEVLARALHGCSRRWKQPFVAVNCGGIPDSLLEAELFGYRRGAFTGAATDKSGLFEAAHRGTLFLDEIAEMPPHAQVKLLRFLDTGEVRRLGETPERRVDARVISATNRPLHDDVADGRFRADLYFRLNVARCDIPPLRARLDDLDNLVAFWLPRIAERLGRPTCRLDAGGLSLLRAHPWPGNVRELRNTLEHAASIAPGEVISEQEIRRAMGTSCTSCTYPVARSMPPDRDAEARRLLTALERHQWKRARAAASLGLSRSTFWRRLRKLDLR